MLSASRACPQKLFAQRGTGTVNTNARVGSGKAMLLGKVLKALLSKIDRTEDFGILRFQTVEDAVETSTDFLLDFGRVLQRGFQLTCPCLECSVFGSVSPIAVNDGIAK
jgi:hypothetical protein